VKTSRLPSNTPFSARIDGNAGVALDLDSHIDTESLLTPPRSLLGQKLPVRPQLKIVMLGPPLASSFGNGAAATYRGLVRELGARGHEVLFLERGPEREGARREGTKPVPGRVEVYPNLKELKNRHAAAVRDADFVLVGSHIAEGIEIGDWVTRTAQGATAFYDLNTAGTIANLFKGRAENISAALIPRYQMYLSFTGGPLLGQMEKQYGSPMARPLYCSVDARLYFPEHTELKWDLGYLGAYSAERQSSLERLFLEPARRWSEGRFLVAGSSYPRSVRWPKNVKRVPLVPPAKRRAFYNSQRFTLNVSPPNVLTTGFAPASRLFEAAACGTPVITEFWPGLDTFFVPDEEILISHSPDETMIYLEEISELERRRLGYRARERVLAKHTTRHRAAELETYVLEVLKLSSASVRNEL
jgi:spore maturation protein CgeB